MNIIILNDYAYINGGAGQVAISSAVNLAKRGYRVVLFTAVGPIDINLLSIKNLQVICLNQYDILNDPKRYRAILNGLWNFSAANKFKELLRQLDRDRTIVHIHACSKALSTSCINVASDLGFTMIYHIHDYGLSCPNLGFYNYQKKSICNLKPLSSKCLISNCDSRAYIHKLWRYLRQIIQQKIGGLPGKINNFVAISEFSLNILKDFLPSTSTVHLISNPINISKQTLFDISKNKYYTFIGRLTPEKNAILLSYAASDLKLPVMFIGEGPDKEKITRVFPHAIMTGWLSSHKVHEHLLKSRALIFTSLWYETQGLVVSEAAACGIPAVVADTCAATDFIIDKVTGLTFKSNNLEDLKDKLMLLKDDKFVRLLSENAYNYFWDNPMSMDKYINDITNVYLKIIHKDYKEKITL